MKDSRNLRRIDDVNRRFRLLQQGKVDIVSFLCKLPKTNHDPSSLVVDVPLTSVNLLVVINFQLPHLKFSFTESSDSHVRNGYFPRTSRETFFDTMVSADIRDHSEYYWLLHCERAITHFFRYTRTNKNGVQR